MMYLPYIAKEERLQFTLKSVSYVMPTKMRVGIWIQGSFHYKYIYIHVYVLVNLKGTYQHNLKLLTMHL